MLPIPSPVRNPNPSLLRPAAASSTSTGTRTSRRLHTSAAKALPGAMGARRLTSAIAIPTGPAPGVPGVEAADANPSLVVVSFYRFADLPDHAAMRKPLRDLWEELRVSGGIILAPEGINGSLYGTRESLDKVLEYIQADERLRGLRFVESPVSPEDEAIHHGHSSHSPLGAGEDAPFRWDHVRVKVKKEIVSSGDPSVMPTKQVGKYVQPKDWNELISDPYTMEVDVRNTYETCIGKFKGDVDPSTTAFRKFPFWVDDKLKLAKTKSHDPGFKIDSLGGGVEGQTKLGEPRRRPRVAMYCTGGIRCEKASSFLLNKGFEEVYHLEGGILKYMEEVPKAENLWKGERFYLTNVFLSSMAWLREASSSATGANNQWVMLTWMLQSGNMVFHVPIVFRPNPKMKKRGREFDSASLRLGVSLEGRTRAQESRKS